MPPPLHGVHVRMVPKVFRSVFPARFLGCVEVGCAGGAAAFAAVTNVHLYIRALQLLKDCSYLEDVNFVLLCHCASNVFSWTKRVRCGLTNPSRAMDFCME